MRAPKPQPVYRQRSFFSRRVNGLREAEDLTASGMTPLEFRPVRSRAIDLGIRGGLSGGLHIWTTESASGFVTVPYVDAAVFSIRFVTSGSLTRYNGRSEFRALPGVGLVQNFDPSRREQASTGFGSIAATVDRAILAAHYQALEGRGDGLLPDFVPVAETSLPSVRAFMLSLMAAHAAIREDGPAAGAGDPLFQEVLLYQFLGGWPRRGGPGAALVPQQAMAVRTAMGYIEANIGERLRISDVAAAAGMSVRSLQTVFKREIGKSILQVIIERRLDSAHADLLDADNHRLLVSQIAYRWGFTHMGDFGRRYRERFGRSPSERRRVTH